MNIFEEKPLMPWTRHIFDPCGRGEKESYRYIYKRYTEPSWKRRGRCVAIVCHTNDFSRFAEYGLFPWNVPSGKEHESGGWGYQVSLSHYIHAPQRVEITEFIEEVFYSEETIGGVMFYADLKLVDLGFKIKDPFNVPAQRKVVDLKEWNGICQRCIKKASGHTMSWFDESLICFDCSNKETLHSRYNEAKEAELDSIHQGNFNFKGIGYTED